MCCSSDNIGIPSLEDPSHILKLLLSGSAEESKYFLAHIKTFNCAFEMISFGANIIRDGGFAPIFMGQDQVYDSIGFPQAVANEEPQFIQLYIFRNFQVHAARCNSISPGKIVELSLRLQKCYVVEITVKSFNCSLEYFPTHNVNPIIHAEKLPTGQHSRRFNESSCNEIAVVLHGDQYNSSDEPTPFMRRKSYEYHEYHLLYVNREDGYHFGTKDFNTSNPEDMLNREVPCKKSYAYRFMTREISFNVFITFIGMQWIWFLKRCQRICFSLETTKRNCDQRIIFI